jgi:hypothetical protein
VWRAAQKSPLNLQSVFAAVVHCLQKVTEKNKFPILVTKGTISASEENAFNDYLPATWRVRATPLCSLCAASLRALHS